MDRLGQIQRSVAIHRIDKTRIEIVQQLAVLMAVGAQAEAEKAEPRAARDLEAGRVADTGRH